MLRYFVALFQRKIHSLHFKTFTRVSLYHDSHYNWAVNRKLAVHRARVCACEMAFAAKSKTDRTDSRALRIVNRLAKESSTWKQIGGLVYSVHQTGYSAGHNSVMVCNENSSMCISRSGEIMYIIHNVFGRGTTITQSAPRIEKPQCTMRIF